MFKRPLAVGLAILCATGISVADELKAATKGKLEAVQTYYGSIESFDNGTLTFAVAVAAAPGTVDPRQQILASPPTMAMTFKSVETELEIRLNVRVPQAPVNGGDNAASLPQKTKDVDVQHALAQQQAATARALSQPPEQRDLRKCSSAGSDEVIEKDADGAEKVPVSGKITSIQNGFATMKRNSDGQELRYRLEDLTRIVLGTCSVPAR